jgi:hypothetical protein
MKHQQHQQNSGTVTGPVMIVVEGLAKQGSQAIINIEEARKPGMEFLKGKSMPVETSQPLKSLTPATPDKRHLVEFEPTPSKMNMVKDGRYAALVSVMTQNGSVKIMGIAPLAEYETTATEALRLEQVEKDRIRKEEEDKRTRIEMAEKIFRVSGLGEKKDQQYIGDMTCIVHDTTLAGFTREVVLAPSTNWAQLGMSGTYEKCDSRTRELIAHYLPVPPEMLLKSLAVRQHQAPVETVVADTQVSSPAPATSEPDASVQVTAAAKVAATVQLPSKKPRARKPGSTSGPTSHDSEKVLQGAFDAPKAADANDGTSADGVEPAKAHAA